MPKIPRPSLDSFNDLVLKQWRNGHHRKAIRFLWYTVFFRAPLLEPVPNFDVFFRPAAQNPLI